MTVFKKEVKQNLLSLCIWTGATAFMIIVCILMFPEIKKQMDSVNNIFSHMGTFTEAFGMNKVNFGELMGFYAVESGNILSIGGGIFSALIGITILSKEEKEHTAEFLLTHPISRTSILIQKLLYVIFQILVFNIVVTVLSTVSFQIIGETIPLKEFLLLHISFTIMQIEISCICFAVSAFLHRGTLGIGIGISISLYFLNIIHNISDSADFLKYITPFSYAEASDIVSQGKLDITLIIIGLIISLISVLIGVFKYSKKDIKA